MAHQDVVSIHSNLGPPVVGTYLSAGDEEGKAKAYEILTTLNKTCHALGTLDTPLVVVMDGITSASLFIAIRHLCDSLPSCLCF